MGAIIEKRGDSSREKKKNKNPQIKIDNTKL